MIKNIIILFMGLILSSGCYTIMKHPAIADDNDPSLTHSVYFSDNCSSCHGSGSDIVVNSSPAYLTNLRYISQSQRWTYYYQHPWWQREVFARNLPGDTHSTESNVLPTTSSRSRFPGQNSGESATPTSIGGSGTTSPNNTTRISSGSNNSPGDTSSTGSGNTIRQESSNSSERPSGDRTTENKDNSREKSRVNKRSKK